MKKLCLLLGLAVASSAFAQQSYLQLPTAGDPAVECRQRELKPTVLATMARDRGMSKQTLLDSFPVAHAGYLAAQAQADLLEDVFGNPDVNETTLVMYRAQKCMDQRSSGAPPVYKPEMKQALVACQREGGDSPLAVGECIAKASAANAVR